MAVIYHRFRDYVDKRISTTPPFNHEFKNVPPLLNGWDTWLII